MDGHSTLDIDGAVVLYIDGAFTLKTQAALNISPGSQLTIHHGSGEFTIGGGGIVNPEAVPAACQVFSATTDMVSFSGGADFYGNWLRPERFLQGSVWFNNYGGIVARQAQISGNMDIHVDASLRGSEEPLVIEGICKLPLSEALQLQTPSGGGSGR